MIINFEDGVDGLNLSNLESLKKNGFAVGPYFIFEKPKWCEAALPSFSPEIIPRVFSGLSGDPNNLELPEKRLFWNGKNSTESSIDGTEQRGGPPTRIRMAAAN